MTKEEKDIKAARIAVRNSYLKLLYGDAQLGNKVLKSSDGEKQEKKEFHIFL